VATFAYLGDEERFYSQYLDVTDPEARKPLTAEPGGAYDMAPVAGYTGPKGEALLPVPPGDGRWDNPEQDDTDPDTPKRKTTSKGGK
jgi:hypothetical protein